MRDSLNKDFYDEDSRAYDEARWESDFGQFTDRVQQSIVHRLSKDWNCSRVAEVGPGTGRFTIPLCRKNNRLTLIDVSKEMLGIAENNLAREGLSGQVDDFITGSIYDLPFDDSSFDHAISLNVLNHLERSGDALCELARIIIPGSTLLFSYANLRSYFWPAARRINNRSHAIGQEVFSRWEHPKVMRRAIEKAGLELLECVGHVHAPRGLEKLPVLPFLKLLDSLSRGAPFSRFATVHFCLCRKA